MSRTVAVVGGGAAGIFAAWRAATLGARVVLLEKTNRLGTKILISGGGKCNVAHDGPIEDVIRAFRPDEARFLRPACYRLRNDQIIELFESRGLRVYTRPDGRVFPVDQTAKDVVEILRRCLEEAGVEVRFESPASGLLIDEGVVRGVRYGSATRVESTRPREEAGYTPNTARNLLIALEREAGRFASRQDSGDRVLRADRVILCSGGSSYPNSGTTGEGWTWVKDAGHTVIKLRAALAPIYLRAASAELAPAHAELAGVSLRDVVLRARQGKEIARWSGDMLFTHHGISGPAALGISRTVAERLECGDVTLEVDLRPAESFEEVSASLSAYARQSASRRIGGFVEGAVPARAAALVLQAASVPPETTCAHLDRKSRNRLATTLKAWPLGFVRHVPLERGEVVAGGVALGEVDSRTMASRKVSGLYLCGEILDVAGPVGGYNLQAAFATGYVAGESAAAT